MLRDIFKKVKRLLGYMEGVKAYMAFGILGLALNRLIAAWMIADLLGNGMAAIREESVIDLIRALLAVLPWFACICVIQALSVWFTGLATVKAAISMRGKLMHIMLNSPLSGSHESHSGAKLSYYTNDIPTAMNSLIRTLASPAGAVVMGLGGLIYVLRVHPSMAAIALGIGAFTYIYSVCFAGWLHRIAMRMQELMAELEIRLKNLLDGMVTSRMYGISEKLRIRMGEAAEKLMRAGVSWSTASGLLGGMNNAVSAFTDNILIFTAGLLFLEGMLSLPELLRVSQMASGIIGVFHISRLLVDVQRSLAGAERVFGYMDSAETEQSGNAVPVIDGIIERQQAWGENVFIEKDAAAIRFNNVSFGYDEKRPVIKGLSFEIKQGEAVAVVGRSGSGKSTILRLIQGLYFPNEGEVGVMGCPLDKWNLQSLRQITVLVPQESVLFPGTIAQNIALAGNAAGVDEKPDMGLVESCAKAAEAHEFITLMPEGYHTVVSERGLSLSGGQRQRIAIARALYRQADIILLDEATSAMDSSSETLVCDTLKSLKGKKTIIFVTHRMSFIKIADRTIVVNSGD